MDALMTPPRSLSSDYLKAFRRCFGLTQAAAAEAVGVGLRSWKAYESLKPEERTPLYLDMAIRAYANNAPPFEPAVRDHKAMAVVKPPEV